METLKIILHLALCYINIMLGIYYKVSSSSQKSRAWVKAIVFSLEYSGLRKNHLSVLSTVYNGDNFVNKCKNFLKIEKIIWLMRMGKERTLK